MAQPPDPLGRHRYEILKIWIPTHGVVNIYRSPRGEYHVDNGYKLEEPVNNYGIERLRVLASQGGVIKIKRDASVPRLQNKYTIDPPNLSIDSTAVYVEDPQPW